MDWDTLARAVDPCQIMRDAGIGEPDPWQRRAVASRADRMLILASRQSGKSTALATIALDRAMHHPDSTVLLFAAVERQVDELFNRKIMPMYRALGRPVAPRRELALSLELENSSRIVCLPGKEANVRSFSSVALAIVDEAARVEDRLISSVSPMLAISRGRLILASTPFGKRGKYFDIWESQDPDWEFVRAVAADCPRYDPAFLESEKRLHGPDWYAQEYESCFIESEGQLFSDASINNMFLDTDDSLIIPGFTWTR
jgi:hypothetical protein